MNLSFYNQQLFHIGIYLSVILLILTIALKLSHKKSLTLYILSLLGLFIALSIPYTFKQSAHNKTAFLIDISNSMPNDDVYKRIKKLYKSENQIYLFSQDITPYAIQLDELKNLNELKSTWKKLGLNKTYVKDNIIKLTTEHNIRNIFLYTDGFESTDATQQFLNTHTFNAVINPLIPDFSKQIDNVKNNILLNVNYNPKEILNNYAKIRLDITNKSKKIRNLKIKFIEENALLYNIPISINKEEHFTKDFFTKPLKKSLNNINIEILDENDKLIQKKELYITATKKDKILLLSNQFQDANYMEKILENLGFDLTSFYDYDSKTFNNLNDYSLIILNNFPFKKLGKTCDNDIKNFVINGGKLLMLGGEYSFGLGGYDKTYIESILPVSFEPPKKEVSRANLGIAVILDSSASMSEGKKIEYLKLASKNLITNLNDEDYLGLIGFNSTTFTLFPITKIKEHRNLAINSLDKIEAFGGTNLMPAINLAIDMLSKVKTGKKHIIILTDGQIPGHLKKFSDVATVIRMIGSTLSTILLGNNTYDKLLKEMAKIGKGNYYEANDEKNLPNIFIEDLKFIKDSKDIKENIFKVEVNTLKNTSIEDFPILRGLVKTTAKNDSLIELYANNFLDKHPLLVSRKVAKGKTLAFTSDMNGRWSNNWISWDNIYLFWEQIINNILQNDLNQEYNVLDYDASYYIRNGSLFFDINIFKNISFNDLSFELTLPNNTTKKIKLEKLALGHYIAKYEDITNGRYKATLRYLDKKSSPIILNIDKDDIFEQKHFTPNMQLLNLIANKHYGEINLKKIDNLNYKNFNEKLDLTFYFLFSSLILFLMGIISEHRS